jgi:hypothetical protein
MVEAMIASPKNFTEIHPHSFDKVVDICFRMAQKPPEIQMTDEAACSCDEMELLTSILGMHLRCRYQDSMGPPGCGPIVTSD